MIEEYKKSEIIIRSGQRQVREFFLSFCLPVGRKVGKIRVPIQVLESDDLSIIKAFLFGLFSADGYFSFQEGRSARIEIQVKSKKLRDDFVSLASQLGFAFR